MTRTKAAAKNGKPRPRSGKKGRLIVFGELDARIDALCKQIPKLSAAEVVRTATEEYLDRIDTDPNILEVMRNPRLRSPTFIAALLQGVKDVRVNPSPRPPLASVEGGSTSSPAEEPHEPGTPPPPRARRRPPSPEDDFVVLPRAGLRPEVKPEDFELKANDGSLLADVAEPAELKPPPDAPPIAPEPEPEEVPVG